MQPDVRIGGFFFKVILIGFELMPVKIEKMENLGGRHQKVLKDHFFLLRASSTKATS